MKVKWFYFIIIIILDFILCLERKKIFAPTLFTGKPGFECSLEVDWTLDGSHLADAEAIMAMSLYFFLILCLLIVVLFSTCPF